MNNLIRILILFFLILHPFSINAQAADSAAISVTVTIAEAENIGATVEFRPRIIREGNRFLWCYIELPEPYRVKDIRVETVKLTQVNGKLIDSPLEIIGRPLIGDYDRDGIPDLRVRFDIRRIIPLFEAAENKLTVEGDIKGDIIGGAKFEGTGTIRFIRRR